MGVVEWFLGMHFSWHHDGTETVCHLNQAGFARNLVELFDCHHRAVTPDATPYRSGLLINSLVTADPEDCSPAQLRRLEAYRSLVGSIGWLSSNTRPDLCIRFSLRSTTVRRQGT